MKEITEDVAEVLILQEKIFSKNFIKFMKLAINASDEQREEVNELAGEIAKLVNGKNRTVCLFVLSYMMSKAFTVEEYEKIESYVGNNIF